MKISKTEGGSSKYRGLGLGALAAIVAIGSASFYYQNSGNEPSMASPLGAVTAESTAKPAHPVKPAEHNPATCGHDHSADKSVVKVISQVVVSDDLDLVNAKVGEVMELAFGDELKLSGKVTMIKEVVGGRKAIGMTLDEQGSYLYWLEDPQGGVIGNIVIKKEEGNQVYKFKSQDGLWSFEEIAFQNYLCASGNSDENMGTARIPSADSVKDLPAGVAADIPDLESKPGAQAVMYLDFDGETVSGTRWNMNLGGLDIVAVAPDLSETLMTEIWAEASEDMRSFEINVTTNRAVFDAAPVNKRMHVIQTTTNDAAPGAGGVAYLESFYDGTIDPCWNFNLSNGDATSSHETGHTFGLKHDGGPNGEEYHAGNGTWGPIMGAPFDHKVISWSKGDYQGATNTFDDDLAIIDARSAPYRPDDYGNTNAEAYALSDDNGNGTVDLTGNVEKTDDVDVFEFATSGGATSLQILPNPNLPNSNYINANFQATLYDANGTEVVTSSDPDFGASIVEDLTAGVYFLHIEGIADGSPDDSGFNDYGSLGIYNLSGSVEGLGGLVLNIVEPKIEDVSLKVGNGLVLKATVQGVADSIQWLQKSGPAGGVAEFESVDTLSTRVDFTKPGLYELAFRGDKAGLDSVEVNLNVSVENVGDAIMFANRGPSIMLTTPEEFYTREGTLTAEVEDDGVPSLSDPTIAWVKAFGAARILRATSSPALIAFKDIQPNEVVLEAWDGEIRTFQRLRVVSIYESVEVVSASSPARWLIPMDDALGLTWVDKAFDHSGWTESGLGIGYNTKPEYTAYVGSGGDLLDVMRGESSSAFVRVPFDVPSGDGYVQGMELEMTYNDGFTVYLNGNEVLRRNVPTGDLHWDSVAARSRSFADVRIPDRIDLFAIGGEDAILLGENILAIHGLNRSASDKEFLLAPILYVGVVNSPYFGFSEEYGGSLDPNGDDDGDGIPNFIEHGRGTDPTVPNTLDHLVLLPDGSMEFTLPVDAPQDMNYQVERSSDLESWATAASKSGTGDWSSNELLISVSSMDADHVTYKLTLPDGSPKAFFRVLYTLRGSQSGVAP